MSQQISDDFLGQRQRRILSASALRDAGINPYPSKSQKTHTNLQITSDFATLEGSRVSVTGRLTKLRKLGALNFASLADQSGSLQIIVKKADITGTSSEVVFKASDVGDFWQVTGLVGKSQTGEISVVASEIIMLGKSIRPLPNSLEHKEDKFRRRYLDMSMHEAVRELFIKKAKFWDSVRQTLKSENFTEVYLPVLEHTTGGADARPFTTHSNALQEDFYLRISLELYCKRAIVGGLDRVFSIGPVFRNEGLSDEHANEYNHIEWYMAYANYEGQMELTRKVMIAAARDVYGKTEFETRGHKFDLDTTWEHIDYAGIIKEKFQADIFTDSTESLSAKLQAAGVHLEGGALNRQRIIDNLWKLIRKTISGPAFLVNHPAFMSPLAKAKSDDPRLTERFQVVIAGTELANGYTEINDPQYQLEQFLAQQRMRDGGDDEAQMLDVDFVEALEYGMPPTTGLGFSERVFWFLADVTAREGTMFPQLKSELDPITKKIYPFIKSENTTKQDKSSKIVIIVDNTLLPWQVLNSVAHASAYIGNRLKENFDTGEHFTTSDNHKHPRNSQYPIVVFAGNSSEIAQVMPQVRSSGMLYHGFIEEMIKTSNDAKLQQMLNEKPDKDVKYLALAIYGSNADLEQFTKKFTLYK